MIALQEDEKLGAVFQLIRAPFITFGQGRAYRGIELGNAAIKRGLDFREPFCRNRS